MKIRIFALAKEMNIDSKELIDACAKVGIEVKHSALASISPEERDLVVAHLKGAASATKPAAASAAAPAREAARAVGKVPELKLAPRPLPPRPSRAPAAETRAAVAVVTETQEDTSTAVAVEPVPETPEAEAMAPVEEPAERAEAPAQVVQEPVAAPPPAAKPAEAPAPAAPASAVEPARETGAAPAETAAAKVAETKPPPAGDARHVARKPGPLSPQRERFIPPPMKPEEFAASGGGLRSLLPKRPTTPAAPARPAAGTAGGAAAGGGGAGDAGVKRPRVRPGPVLPNLAPIGNFKPVAPKPETPAQKPVVKLPADVLSGAKPLGDIISRHAEDKKKRKPPPVVGAAPLTAGIADADDLPGRKGAGSLRQGAGLSTARKERQERRIRNIAVEEDDERVNLRARHKRARRPVGGQIKTSAVLAPPITVRTVSEAIGRPAGGLVKALFLGRGMNVNINSSLDEETAVELAMEFGVDLKIQREETMEEVLAAEVQARKSSEKAVPRPPIVTILGHVDHGKTTLLDKIRSANVAGGEFGGITQHIAAYQVEHQGQKVTFVDTPGHAAFGEMRARGANVTDIVVLVVAANDGVQPQTVEAISHARAAGVPIIVALNKCDLPGINENRVLQELAAQNVLVADWGGDVELVRTSGLTGQGLDTLLETIQLTAELQQFKADPSLAAAGVCLEAFRDEGRGTIAWLIVQAGTLRVGDAIVCGEGYGRIRAMYNDRDQEIAEAGPSTPVKVSGLDNVPRPGDRFLVVADLEQARLTAEERREKDRQKLLTQRSRPRRLEDILETAKEGEVRDLFLIVKADTPGSLEALRHEIGKFSHPEVRVKLLHEGVGGVNESDIALAHASDAIVIAFHVVPEDRAREMAERDGVQIREYNIIYEVTDHIKQALEGLLKPEIKQIFTGRALVLRTFTISRVGTVAGCRVLNGTIERSHRVRLIRESRILNEYGIGSLKREKEDVKEVREGMECGIKLENFNDVKEGDLLEAFRVEEIKRTL